MCLTEGCGNRIGQVMYVIERLALCCAATAVVTCLIATIMIILGMGIGVGYNYCFVETKVSPLSSANSGFADTDDSSVSSDSPPANVLRSKGEDNKSKTYYKSRNMLKVNHTLPTNTTQDQSLKLRPGGLIFQDTYNKRVAPTKNITRILTPLVRLVPERTTTTLRSSHITEKVTNLRRTTPEETHISEEGDNDLRSILSRLKNKKNIWS